jgi:hypothetical protein
MTQNASTRDEAARVQPGNAFLNLTEAIRDNSSLFRFWNGQRACISRPVRLCVNAPHSGRRKSGFSLHRDEFYALQRVLSGRYFSRLRPFCQIEGQALANSFT